MVYTLNIPVLFTMFPRLWAIVKSTVTEGLQQRAMTHLAQNKVRLNQPNRLSHYVSLSHPFWLSNSPLKVAP